MASGAGGGHGMQLQEDRPLHKTTEDPLDNIDLGSVSRKGHANLASSLWSKAVAIFVRFDIEIVIGILIIIFFCTVFSIFTRDAGWFVLDAPFEGSESRVAFISVGLQTFTISIDDAASSVGRVVVVHAQDLLTVSPEAYRLGAFLYVCLLLSLLLSVGMLWYIALFYSYMKGSDPRPDKEFAVRSLGALGILVALLLFSVGTCAYLQAVTHGLASALPSLEGLEELNVEALGVQTDYAYELTVAAWFFWLLAGSLFVVRRAWARRKQMDEHHLTGLDDISVG